MSDTVRAWVEVNLNHIKDNIKSIKSLLKPGTKFMAVVKANAYGHGLIPVALAAQEGGADRLGVALTSEAVALRKAGVTLPIHILSEPPLEDIGLIYKYNLIPTVYTVEMLKALAAAGEKNSWRQKIHIKVDTGMRRVGVSLDKISHLYAECKKYPQLFVEGIFTHFACADKPESNFTEKQLKAFLSLKQKLNIPLWHCANSAATFYWPATHLDMVRIGISMYGLPPGKTKLPITLKPALSLKTKIAYLQTINKGEGVSYGLNYIADRKTQIGVLPLGYGDGYSRRLSNLSDVIINGERNKVVGSICMDQLMVALTGKAKVGDEVVLIGRQGKLAVTVDELAEKSGTINYEIVCSLNERLPRLYIE